LGPTKVFCQNRVEIINGLNSIIKPITTVSFNDSFKDIDFLKEAAKGAKVIGIGESTHGTILYNMYRQRLVRFFVQEMGYKAIIDEGDIIAAEKVDAYINGKTDSLELIGGLQPVVTNKKELDWLRAYNSNKPENQRVHIYGAEVRNFNGIAQKIKDLFFQNETNDTLKIFEGYSGVGYKNLTKRDFEYIQALSQRLIGECRSRAQRYYLSLLNQIIDFAYHYRFGRFDFNNSFNIRDKYMFENIKSIISGAPQNKAIILAHNGHLQKTKFMAFKSLGYLLSNFYGNKYFVAATDFNTGNVSVYNFKTGNFDDKFYGEVKDKDAVEYYFAQCKYPNFFLSINDALKNPATASFVNKKHKMLRNMGSTGAIIKSSIRLSENYDLIIFFNNTDVKKNK
jgi:erythromycin esterase-like protein